ncbi:MAG: hypothetical protein GW854_10850 [Erythrobacter sp.]|nr:hypothetical protein [Erythrobacter sp.]
MAIDKEKQRARWLRNQKAYRLRRKGSAPALPPIDPNFESAVWAEAEKRLRNFPWSIPDLKPNRFYPRQTNEKTYPFICDVWAAITLLKSQREDRPVTNAMIGSFLLAKGRDYGVKQGSLRTKIPRARKIIEHLEDSPATDTVGSYWPQFPETIPERGSGVHQHVAKVMDFLEAIRAFERKPK